MAWLESHQSLRDHPKKDRLAELLFNGSVPIDVGDYAAAGLLHYLWYWALDYAHDGDLSRFSDSQIAKGCRYHGDGMTLIQSLIEAGFLDEDRHIHDWDEYAGRLLAKRDQDRTRKKEWRVRVPSASPDADAPRDGERTDRPTNKPKKRISNPSKVKDLVASIPQPTCPTCNAHMADDGDGKGGVHCPVCRA